MDNFERWLSESPLYLLGILATGFYTGMRKGETVALTWDKVDLESLMITLRAADTKDKAPRKIPICDELYKILKTVP